MAYVSQDLKARLAPQIKAVLKKYGVKGTIAVRNRMTLCLTLKSGPIDFIGNYRNTVGESQTMKDMAGLRYLDVNKYWYQDHFNGKAKEFLREAFAALNDGNHDNSRSEIDYFDVGWYVDLHVGKWDKPYEVVA